MRQAVCNPATEVSGQTLQAYIHNVQADVILPIFEKYGYKDIDPNKWYPLQPLLNVLYELGTNADATSNLVAIGVKIAEYGVEPVETDRAPLHVVLEHWDQHMYASIRGSDIGHILTEKLNDKSYRVTHKHLIPDDLCYGLAYGFARSRLPKGTSFKVEYEDYNHRVDNGNGDKTVILVTWG